MPPTLLVTSEFDPLKKEIEQFADVLKQAHILTELHIFPACLHAFLELPMELPQKEPCMQAIAHFLSRMNKGMLL